MNNIFLGATNVCSFSDAKLAAESNSANQTPNIVSRHKILNSTNKITQAEQALLEKKS